MNVFDALTDRTSVNYFDSSRSLSNEEILALLDYAQQAPSAFNIQHTRYLVVTDPQAKEQLKEAAYGQQKVVDAAAVILVLADELGHERMAGIAQRGVDAGVYNEGVRDYMVQAVHDGYSGQAAKAHDEALRSASMATMNLMTAATGKGLATCPMIGFDAEQVKALFAIGERYTPAMMVTLGYAKDGNWGRKPRLAAAEVSVLDARPGQAHALN